MKNIDVYNMKSSKGNDVPNQFIVHVNNATYFKSYNTIIAKSENGIIILDEEKWDYSKTTGKYRNQFLGETISETRQKIKNGTYKLANLNN